MWFIDQGYLVSPIFGMALISVDTGGRKSELTWSLAGDNLEQIMEKYLKSHKQKDPASTIRAGIDSALKTIFGY
mgnify:CR=1 FL=1